jgi:hypothetical protein
MNSSPLENLHCQFDRALKHQAYLGLSSDTSQMLQETKTKQIRLSQVFEIARQQIEKFLRNNSLDQKDLNAHIDHLRLLQDQGKLYYERYVKATKSWTRVFLKGLARYTPAYLKRFLPKCFSNQMTEAEEKTRQQYDEYCSSLKEFIAQLTRLKTPTPTIEEQSKAQSSLDKEAILTFEKNNISTPKDQKEKLRTPEKKPPKNTPERIKQEEEKFLHEDEDVEVQALLFQQFQNSKKGQEASKKIEVKEIPVSIETSLKEESQEDVQADLQTQTAVPSLEEIEKQKQQIAAALLNEIQASLQVLNRFNERPLSLMHYKKLLGKISNDMRHFLQLAGENGKKSLENIGVSEEAFQLFSGNALTVALMSGNTDATLTLLQPLGWDTCYQEALGQKGYINFGVRRTGVVTVLLSNAQNERVHEKTFINYRGHVKLTLEAETQAENLLNALLTYLKDNPKCRPNKIEIDFVEGKGKNCALTPKLCKLLMDLSDRVAEIQLNNLKEINFKALNFSAEEERQFVQHLKDYTFNFPVNITLSDQPKKDWTPFNFSVLLSLCPTLELLKEMYRLCPTPCDIYLPPMLCQARELDLSGYPLEHIPHLIAHFGQLTHLNLSGLAITDAQLKQWIDQGYLANIQSLQLDQCTSLTADILPTLAKLPHLTQLSLPDLPQGKIALAKLPKFDDPFKINLFYTSSKATQKIASLLYTGPVAWAAAFQIPLARQGVAEVFTSRMKILDPKSVAYWLHNDEYKKLAPQTAIKTIFADSNAALNDANLAAFVQKFPQATALSLYNCPNITHQGILSLLKACPQIRVLDLTGCHGINEQLFFENDSANLLKKLNKLNVTDTGILSDIVDGIRPQFKGVKIICKETTLKITDAQLANEASLEGILKSTALNQLKRIDLSDCTKLTDAMLGKLLAHLNDDMWKKTSDGFMEDNPQRLNLAVLDLTGCSNITDAAFKIQEGEKVDLRLLENLDRVIIGGTKISKSLEDCYPGVTFQTVEQPVTIQVDPEAQLKDCQAYYAKKGAPSQDSKAQRELKNLAHNFIHNRLVVGLFSSDCKDQAAVSQVLNQPMAIQAPEFCNFAIYFKCNSELLSFPIHRDVLASQSRFFIESFRPGGALNKIADLTFEIPHLKEAKLMKELLFGEKDIEDLDWQGAIQLAEPVHSNNYNVLPTYFRALLKRIRSQFDLNNADKMFFEAHKLRDRKAISQYEQTLLTYLDHMEKNPSSENQRIFKKIALIAKNYPDTELYKKVTAREEAESYRVAKATQEAEYERLTQEMLRREQAAARWFN